MRKIIFGLATGVACLGAVLTGSAQAAPVSHIDPLAGVIGAMSSVDEAQFVTGGRRYCFYPNGWRGPGFYQCGYAFRRGLGWGGPVGWNGWRAGGQQRYIAGPRVRPHQGPRVRMNQGPRVQMNRGGGHAPKATRGGGGGGHRGGQMQHGR